MTTIEQLTFERLPWKERISKAVEDHDLVFSRLWTAVNGRDGALPAFTDGRVTAEGTLVLTFMDANGEEHTSQPRPKLATLAGCLSVLRDATDLDAAETREFYGLFEQWFHLPHGAIELALRTI